MLRTTIGVRRKLPVINGFVMIPDGQAFLRTKLTPIDVLDLIPGSTLIQLGSKSNLREIVISDPTSLNLKATTSRSQERYWVQLPEYNRLDGSPSDWFQLLREVAELV